MRDLDMDALRLFTDDAPPGTALEQVVLDLAQAARADAAESTANYKAHVAKRLGIGLHDRIPPSMLRRVSQAMIEIETGNRAD